jgi:TPR repeat protein
MTVQDEERLAATAIDAGYYGEAIRLLRPLAERNSEYALLMLGWIYDTGAAGASDKEAARAYYEHAASRGSAAAYLYLGWLLLGSGEESQAYRAFEAGAQLGSEECRLELEKSETSRCEELAAKAVKTGNYKEAFRLLQPLAERNSEYALHTLGCMFETGAVGPADKNAARSYYERAVALGSASACFNFGRVLLAEGQEAEARAAYEIGAKGGDVACMSKLGRMLVEGRGGPADVSGGSAWLKKATARGHIFAQRTLLEIELHKATSVFERLIVKTKIIVLAVKGAKELLVNGRTDNLT